ncbi:hypothetical protein HOLleu_14091 [Holothuria leucospilota]|uniref:Uncharacterized protein n=1 Tax=Holothuria leucospilota TaxID=206669 RepID=A0A9Q1HC72_HOLLE|nr:hypothetical protein HOLleu_14091 [Holothuria leucospilota]
MGEPRVSTIATLLDILNQKWPKPFPERNDEESSNTPTSEQQDYLEVVSTGHVDIVTNSSEIQAVWSNVAITESTVLRNETTYPQHFTDSSYDWETTLPMSTTDFMFEGVLSFYYGFAIAILILALIVLLIVIFLCCERLRKRQRRVKFAPSVTGEPAVFSGATARREVFHTLANRSLNSEMSPCYDVKVSPQSEEIPMREFISEKIRPMEMVTSVRHGREKSHLTRIHAAKRWTPDYNGNLMPVAVTNAASSRWRKIAMQSEFRKSRYSQNVNLHPRTYSEPVRKIRPRSRLPKFTLAGEPIMTSSEPSFISGSHPRSPESDEVPGGNNKIKKRLEQESSLIVPTNSPNCSSDEEHSGSVFQSGRKPVVPDSDFGASAGVSQCIVSSNTSMNEGESLASNSYVWDGYDPSFRQRHLSYVDGAYYPVLEEKQYWV